MNKRKTATSNKNHYVDKQELVDEVKSCQDNDLVSDALAEMFIKIVDGVVLRFPNAKYYGVEDDVKQDCLLLLCKKYKNFDTKKGTSCFAYMTTVIYNQLRYQCTRVKKYKDRKDHLTEKVREYAAEHLEEFQ